jgi:hypothetical protein
LEFWVDEKKISSSSGRKCWTTQAVLIFLFISSFLIMQHQTLFEKVQALMIFVF